ncbi:trigger factor [Desulfobotulus sp. H1]|uniref:Trigger factor n=1 Tax=Desulfobotulus pelophilus TaxID=2823377 RepID=A0ABT3NC85_9BACT|nr:trigger factor [Desulfobotulus pelophilus]MCW7754562.1 trigger factor [Desulfobotulus pelophilus]
MQVTVEDLSTVKKTLHIEIPGETVAKAVDAAYQDLKKTVKIKGFRPGKTPRSVLERMYKKDVHADVSQKLIQDAFVGAVRDNNLNFIGTPDIDAPDLDVFNEKEPLKVGITLEVRPEIGEVDFKGIAIRKTLYAFSEEEVDGQIEMLRRNLAKKVPITEERPARAGDFVLIDYEGRLVGGDVFDGTPVTENHAYLLGRNTLSPAFDENLEGMAVGETRTFDVSYDDQYINKAFAGKTISFTVTLKSIHEEILPELDADFAKNFGAFESVEDIREKIRENLQQGYDKRIEQEVNEQIFSELIGKTSFEVPDVMVNYELEGILEEAERAFSANGVTFEQLGQTRETLADEYRELAEKQVRRHLILGAIIHQEKLSLDKDEVEAGLEELARNFNQPVDLIRGFYESNPEKLEFLQHTLLEKKAIQLILENSVIEEVAPEAVEAADDEGAEA